jgi:hypothetical protein
VYVTLCDQRPAAEHHPAVVPGDLGGAKPAQAGRLGDDVIGLDVDVVAGLVVDGLYFEPTLVARSRVDCRG